MRTAGTKKPTANIYSVKLVCEYYGLDIDDIVDYARTATLNLYGEFNREPDLMDTLRTLSYLLSESDNEYVIAPNGHKPTVGPLLDETIKSGDTDIDNSTLCTIAVAFGLHPLSLIEMKNYNK